MGGFMSYFRNLFGSKEMRILILGLDGAGKTTLLYRLQVIFARSQPYFAALLEDEWKSHAQKSHPSDAPILESLGLLQVSPL